MPVFVDGDPCKACGYLPSQSPVDIIVHSGKVCMPSGHPCRYRRGYGNRAETTPSKLVFTCQRCGFLWDKEPLNA